LPNSATSAQRLNSCAPTCAAKTMRVAWSIGPSRVSAAWTPLSTTPVQKASPGPVTEQSAESYAATFDTNVLGTLLSMKHELRVMLAHGHGSIVNVSSIVGRIGAAGASVYVASKHAVEGLTKSAALEAAASGVRVNVVAPGPIDTGMLTRFTGTDERKAGLVSTVPLKRAGRTEEVAQTIGYLLDIKPAGLVACGAGY
jgi:NAD(P)-dependent dehydrogenase (short-subunit alcohol dehydrogenase family)